MYLSYNAYQKGLHLVSINSSDPTTTQQKCHRVLSLIYHNNKHIVAMQAIIFWSLIIIRLSFTVDSLFYTSALSAILPIYIR